MKRLGVGFAALMLCAFATPGFAGRSEIQMERGEFCIPTFVGTSREVEGRFKAGQYVYVRWMGLGYRATAMFARARNGDADLNRELEPFEQLNGGEDGWALYQPTKNGRYVIALADVGQDSSDGFRIDVCAMDDPVGHRSLTEEEMPEE